ncbi:MAG TPA: ABC transporter ATP-binding protein [Polyangiaceae bacterium]
MTAWLSAEGVGIEFGGLKALSNFNLEVGPGHLLGLIGPNGAGKTTAFNLLTGAYEPTSGQVRVGGVRVNGKRPHQITQRGVARTFQNIRLFKELSVLDNVKVACLAGAPAAEKATGWAALAREYAGWWRAFLRTRGHAEQEANITELAERMLDLMGMLEHKTEVAKDLPYGKQRRLEIARALATRPKVLLLDEPAAGMNPSEKVELMGLIRDIRDRLSLGILVIEHDMKLVMGICESITVLDHGETIAVGTPEHVRSDPKVIEAYLGDSTAFAKHEHQADSGSRSDSHGDPEAMPRSSEADE